jgi:error-prone DNA polymerase
MYLELHASSAFSFLDGASLPETLVDRAADLGYSSLALLDRDGVYGAPRFHLAAKRAGVRAIIGAELTIRASGGGQVDLLAPPSPYSPGSPHSPFVWHLPVLVASQEGYRNLCRLVTTMKLGAPKGEGALSLTDLDGRTGGLVALLGRAALAVGRHGVGGLVDRLIGLFGRSNLYVELQRHLLRDEEADTQTLVDLASAFHVPVVATNGVRFATPDARPLHDVLVCIRHKTTLERAGRRLARNAERYLKPPGVMARLFADMPEAVAATRALGERLTFTMADLGYRFPEYPVPAGETMISFLRKIVHVGARDRYRPYLERARRQIERELDLIEKLDLAGYFLIVWDLVNFCRGHDILVQGRGSAANSAVCYSLGITAVDPVGMDLLFERFLSEERGEWPDIDLDLPSGDRREQVIQYVYGRYGRLGAGMTANVITYRGRSAAREVGKVLGIEPDRIDRLAKVMNNFEWQDPAESLARNLIDSGLEPDEPQVRLFADLWRRIQHLPRHLGQHSGGMVICQGRLDEVVPLENASMPGRVVVQWDKDDCADMGIVKVDLLGLGMMAALQDALALVHQGRGSSPLDLAHLPPDDPAVYRMLQDADTIGVFQVESRAQMATLPRLRPERFYDIVVEVAIIRPGPIVGQMVHPYLRRRAGREPIEYPAPSLAPILERTLGVPLFQEQLIRMAMVAAGFTGGQAEELRRAFGFKRSEARMAQIERQLRDGMARQGITDAAADAITRSITSFALYGFPESHAASFALLVYASAYLKAHYPAAFYTALLNNQPMGFYHPASLVKDAQRRGVRFAGIDVQRSSWDCRIEPDGAIRLGLKYVAGLREEVGRAIERGPAGGRRSEAATPAPERGAASDSICTPDPDVGPPMRCPKCGGDDPSMLEVVSTTRQGRACFCSTCAADWEERACGQDDGLAAGRTRFIALEQLIAASGIRRDELATLAEIGALNSFGCDRRTALWQIERAIRPAGELFEPPSAVRHLQASPDTHSPGLNQVNRSPILDTQFPQSPIPSMTLPERVLADYTRTGLTIGPHPMALRRSDLALRGVMRATDLPRARDGRKVRVAGAVITRQRPGTAKGFVFLTLEDETGIANVIVRPDLFRRDRLTIVEEPFLLIEGVLQIQDGVTSVKADRVEGLSRGEGPAPELPSHDFH